MAGASRATEKPEFRAVWVTAWQPGLLTPAEVDETIRLAKLANLNALIVQVRKVGDAYYDSDFEPRGENLTLPDYDPLDYIIKQAHEAGLEVHIWMNVYKIWQGQTAPRSPDHVFNKHPEWICKSSSGERAKDGQYALDPGIPEVQRYTASVFLDCVRKYDADGLHLDYVRYWDSDYGYSDLAVARFNREKGRTGVPKPTDPEWCQWRRDRVTDLVRDVYRGVKEIKPHVKVTAAVTCSGDYAHFRSTQPYKRFFQDWEGWLREGIIDAVIPMNYRSEANPKDAGRFRQWTSAAASLRHGRHVYNGLSVQGSGSLVAQIKESRNRDADGIVGFHFNASADRDGIALALREQVFQMPVPTPAMAWKPMGTRALAACAGPKELFGRAVLCSSKGDVDGAIEFFKKAIEADASFAEAHYRLGCCYLRKGMKDEAAAEFRKTLDINPAHGGALVGLRRL